MRTPRTDDNTSRHVSACLLLQCREFGALQGHSSEVEYVSARMERTPRTLALLGALVIASLVLAFGQQYATAAGPSPDDQYVWVADIGAGRDMLIEAIAVDPTTGNLLATESDRYIGDPPTIDQVAEYTSADWANSIATLGSSGSAEIPPQFSLPAGLAMNSLGQIIVADSENNRIMIVTSSSEATAYGSEGTAADGEYSYPMGSCVDSSDNIYVGDTNNGRIQVLNPAGIHQWNWNIPDIDGGAPPAPDGLCVRDGYLYVADPGQSLVFKYNLSTQQLVMTLSTWTDGGTGDSFENPQGVYVDAEGSIYVADTTKSRIVRFRSTGEWLQTIGGFGLGPGEFAYPEDVWVDETGDLYVADTGNSRIQKLQYVPDVSDSEAPVTISNIPADWTTSPFLLSLNAVDAKLPVSPQRTTPRTTLPHRPSTPASYLWISKVSRTSPTTRSTMPTMSKRRRSSHSSSTA